MRSFIANEISPSDIHKIEEFLRQHAIRSALEKLYWTRLPEELLSGLQTLHPACQPHVFAVELGHDYMRMEFYIRSLTNMSCTCQDYCTSEQRAFILSLADRILVDLEIRT